MQRSHKTRHSGASVWPEHRLFGVQTGVISAVAGDEEGNVRETMAKLNRACSIPNKFNFISGDIRAIKHFSSDW